MERPGGAPPHDWSAQHPPHTSPQYGQQRPPPPQYGQAPPYQTAQAPQGTQQTNVFAILSLIAAIAGFTILPGIGSIIAVVFAVLARNELQKDPHQRGRELANWGLGLGIVGLVIWALFALFMVFVGMLFGGGFWGPWWRGW